MSANDKSKRKKLDDLQSQLAKLGYDSTGGQIRKKGEPFVKSDVRRTLKGQKKRADTKSKTPGGAAVIRKPGGGSVVYRRDLPFSEQARRPRLDEGPSVSLTDAVPGTETPGPIRGRYYHVASTAAESDGNTAVAQAFSEALRNPLSGMCARMDRVEAFDDLGLEDFVFMDIESTGLGNSPLFLIGAMVWTGEDFEVQQFLARDYAEEGAVVAAYHALCDGRRVLVTFNGKSFDLPYIRARAAATGVPFAADLMHFDLLHESRRAWKDELPNCKLQTLEAAVCGRETRTGDIPGGDIPDAYHDFVRTGNARLIVNVMRHNARDLITLADLMARLPRLPS